jgi:ATP-binding protein involved in chromosome partitioning
MDDRALKHAAIEIASKVLDPVTNKSILDAHLLEEIDAVGGVIKVRLLFPEGYEKAKRWELEDTLSDRLGAIEGSPKVEVAGFIAGFKAPTPAEGDAGAATADSAKPAADKPAAAKPAGPPGGGAPPVALAGVGRVIAVASGKGGVGKSTVSVNLALALKRLGFNVGLLDVDVYGPSLPTLLGVNERPNVQDRRILPIEAQGLKLMSLGFLMEDDTPVIWRGPIVTGIIRQFLQDVDWSGVDYLIVDMPPGTGDAQLSLAQTVPVDGAVVVTTPSDLALIDAARGLRMFRTLNVDVIGIVENMSWFEWPGADAVDGALRLLDGNEGAADAQAAIRAALDAHRRIPIFGSGGGRTEATRLEVPFLGEIPLDGAVRKGGDEGRPLMVSVPDGPVADAFLEIAQRVVDAKPLLEDGAPAKKKGMFSFLKS